MTVLGGHPGNGGWQDRRGMARAVTMALLLIVAGCSVGNDSEPIGYNTPEKTTDAPEGPRDLRVGRISSGAPGQGPRQPRVVMASSATALSGAVGADVPDSGSGAYLATYWGQKPTGGYSLAIESARLEGDRVTVRLALKEPPRDAILTQAFTYPYAVAVIRELDPRGKDFSFVDEECRELGWSVRRVGE